MNNDELKNTQNQDPNGDIEQEEEESVNYLAPITFLYETKAKKFRFSNPSGQRATLLARLIEDVDNIQEWMDWLKSDETFREAEQTKLYKSSDYLMIGDRWDGYDADGKFHDELEKSVYFPIAIFDFSWMLEHLAYIQQNNIKNITFAAKNDEYFTEYQ